MYVIMIVPSDFPNGDAGAVRDDAFARIYMEIGYDVRLVGKGKGEKNGWINGIQYESIYEDISGIKGNAKRFIFDAIKYEMVIDKWIGIYGKPSIIHINSIPERVIRHLIRFSKKNNIPIVHDSVEWYSPCEFSIGKLDKAYILKDRLNRKVIRNPIRVYSISRYLDKHFTDRNLRSCRIPVIMDVQNANVSNSIFAGKIRLIYAGSPAKKDYLKEIITGIEMLTDDEKQKIEFNIFGATKEEIKILTDRESFSTSIIIHGRVPRGQVQKALIESDFSVLLRPSNERYTKAGFPTKSVEAMSHGVAMLCNISSDLGLYLQDMKNAIIVKDCTSDEFVISIRRILELNEDKISSIKNEARKTAENYFDYRIYKKKVEAFLQG